METITTHPSARISTPFGATAHPKTLRPPLCQLVAGRSQCAPPSATGQGRIHTRTFPAPFPWACTTRQYTLATPSATSLSSVLQRPLPSCSRKPLWIVLPQRARPMPATLSHRCTHTQNKIMMQHRVGDAGHTENCTTALPTYRQLRQCSQINTLMFANCGMKHMLFDDNEDTPSGQAGAPLGA